jgi:hypothetical protein
VFLPLVPGARWVYRVASAQGRDEIEVVAHGEHAVQGCAFPLFLLEERMDGEDYGLQDAGWVGYFRAEGYWSRYASIAAEGKGRFRVVGSGALRVLPVNPQPGDEWEETLHGFESPPSQAGEQHWKAVIEPSALVRTPAGRFREVIVVRSSYWDPALSRDAPLAVYEDVYARGIGLVRSRIHNLAEQGGDLEQTLVAVHFPEAVP